MDTKIYVFRYTESIRCRETLYSIEVDDISQIQIKIPNVITR